MRHTFTWWWSWWIVFVVWLTDERLLSLFPARTIVRDPHHREYPTCCEQDWTCAEPGFRLCCMKLCSSDNHYTTTTKGFVFSLYRCSKQLVSCLLTLNWSEPFIPWGCFQICSANNNASLLLHACEVIHLVNKGVTSPYVQE